MRLARLLFAVLQRVAPERAAALAERLFFTPPRTRLARELTAVLERGSPFFMRVNGRRVCAWTWGEGAAPAIALMHGWGSRGGRLAHFVAPLVAAGFRVVTHDAPGHGVSDPGMSSMPEFARTLWAVADRAGPLHAVVAHSMGASATALAMAQGLRVPRAAFLAPAANPAAFVDPFASLLRLTPDTCRRMQERSERRLDFRWHDLDVPTLARTRPLTAPLLVVHDRDDGMVPWDDGSAIAAAWPGAVLVSTSGLGHRDVVRDARVVTRVLEFITGAPGGALDGGGDGGGAEPALLERDLFDRDTRLWRSLALGLHE